MVNDPPAMHETWVRFLGWEDPLEKGKATQWRIPWTEEPAGYSPWGRKESDMTEQLSLFFSLREKLISKIPSTPNILEYLAIIGYRLTLYLS